LLGHRDSLQQFFYNRPALEPLMAWKSTLTPNAPTNVVATPGNATALTLNWTKAIDGASEYQKTRQFVIYRSTVNPVDITDANNILFITNNDLTTTYFDNTLVPGVDYFYVVTALNRIHGESVVSNTVTNNPLPLKLNNFYVKNVKENIATFAWSTSNELNVSHFELQNSTNEFLYNTVEKLAAKNKSSNNYELNTSFKSGTTQFYRLKMLDNDGKFEYSNVVKIAATNNVVQLLNTTTVKGGNLQYSLSTEDKNASYVIVDASARVLQLGKLNNSGVISLSNNINTGIYYLKVIHQHKTYTHPIFVK
jgi:hypothetical protein